MPKRPNTRNDDNGTTSEVKARREKRLPRKGTKVSLPFRTGRDAKQQLGSDQHPSDLRARPATHSSGKDQAPPRFVEALEIEGSDEPKPRVQPRIPTLKQRSAVIITRSGSNSLLIHNGSKARLTVRGTQDRTGLLEYINSPYVLLGSGGGDPFSTLPSDLPRAFLDEHIHTIPKILASMVSRGSSGEDYGKAWAMQAMSSMMSNMALFYAMIFAEMLHTRVKGGDTLRSPLELEVAARAIRLISQEMQRPERARLDSSIWVVVILGFAGKEAQLRIGSKYPRQSFLKELQDLHIYCKMEVVLEHVLGLIRLVGLIGGLQNVKMPGMAQVISFCGIMAACRSLQRPIFPFMAHSNQFMVDGRLSVSEQEREWTWSTLDSLGTGFWEAWGSSRAPEVKELCFIIIHICDFTIVVENYIQGRWTPRTATVIIDQRNFVQHSLMSLKSRRDLFEEDTALEEILYESCRLAVIVFSFLIVFPLPPVAGPFETLTEQLLVELRAINIFGEPKSRSRLLLWILVMAAIAAVGLPERGWFVERVRDLSLEMFIGDWQEMKDVLQSFLWLPSTNDPDGQDLWTELQLEAEIVS